MIETSDPAAQSVCSPVAEGEILSGKYRVGRLLGAGSMGVVVAARHLDLGHQVAIKFLGDRVSQQGWATERFRRESRALASIQSPHVARVLDAAVMPGGRPYFVMEYLEGNNLLEEMRRRGPIPVAEAAELLRQVAGGLVSAHNAGIVHRDLKPSNLFLTSDGAEKGQVKIFDFGIARALREQGSQTLVESLTDRHAVLGSPAYMAPEQLEGRYEIDERADIWACGVTLFQLVTGELPYAGDNPATVALAVHSKIRPTGSEHPKISKQLGEVIDRCLSVEREGRYSSAAELKIALAPLASAGLKETGDIGSSSFSFAPSSLDIAEPGVRRFFKYNVWLLVAAAVPLGGLAWFGFPADNVDGGAEAPKVTDSELPSNQPGLEVLRRSVRLSEPEPGFARESLVLPVTQDPVRADEPERGIASKPATPEVRKAAKPVTRALVVKPPPKLKRKSVSNRKSYERAEFGPRN